MIGSVRSTHDNPKSAAGLHVRVKISSRSADAAASDAAVMRVSLMDQAAFSQLIIHGMPN